MFTVYIRNYLDSSGNYITSEKVFFKIPTTPEDPFPVKTATISSNEGAADSFNFTMEANSPYYNSMVHFKTLFRVLYDDEVIFFGRVLTETKSTILQTKEVRCEGALSFLNDTQYEGIREEKLTEISITDYFSKIISNHNSQVDGCDWKKVYKGNISFNPTSERRKYEPTSWTDSASLIKDCASDYGGYIKARYSGEKVYLDWYRYYYKDRGSGNRPQIVLGKNLLDFSNSTDVDNIFTRLIPVGATKKDGSTIYVSDYTYTDKSGSTKKIGTKYIPVSIIPQLYSNADLDTGFHHHTDYIEAEDDYTPVYKTQSFPNADTVTKLWNYSIDFIKNNYYKASSSFSIKAIDMRILDDPDVSVSNRSPKILIGEVVDITYPVYKNGIGSTVKRSLVCKALQYDLFNPDKNSYTFGVPNEPLDHEYGVKKKQKKAGQNQTSSGTTARHGGGGGKKDPGPLTFESIANTILERADAAPYGGTAAYKSFVANGPMSGTTYCYDPVETGIITPSIRNKDQWILTTIIGRTTNYGVGFAEGVGLFAYDWGFGLTPKKIRYWYQKYTGDDKVTYQGPEPVTSSFFGDLGDKIKAIIHGDKSTLDIGEKSPGIFNIRLNDTSTYTVNGVTYTKDGFITAVDIKTPDYPSLSVGILTATEVATETLRAVNAFIKDLTTDTANARNVYTNKLFVKQGATVLTGDLQVSNGKVTALGGVLLPSTNKNLKECFIDVSVSALPGRVLSFTFTRADGQTKTVSTAVIG